MLYSFIIWSRMSSKIVPTNCGARYHASLNNEDAKPTGLGCRIYEVASDLCFSVVSLLLRPSLLAQFEVNLNFAHAAF